MFQDCWGPRTQPRDQTVGWLRRVTFLSLFVLPTVHYKRKKKAKQAEAESLLDNGVDYDASSSVSV